MNKKLIPNSTQTPNILIDKLMPFLTGAEFKVLMYVVRRTFGFHKKLDKISYSQFITGIKNNENEILDYGAGVSRGKLSEVLTNLVAWEVFNFEKRGQYNAYGVNLDIDIDEVVQKLNQFRNYTGSSSETEPEVVQKLNTQKKEKQRETKKDFSNEKSSSDELHYEEPTKDTYKTKKKIYAQKGLDYRPPKRSNAQERAWDTELLARYLQEKAMTIHGVELYVNRSKAGKHWTSLKRGITSFGLETCKKMVDFYLNSEKYNKFGCEPNKVFSDDSINIYLKDNKPIVDLGKYKFYNKAELDQAEKDGKIKYDWKSEKWIIIK